MSSSAAGKRRRDTQSGDELAAAAVPNTRQAKKRLKDASTELSDSESDISRAGNASDSGVSAVADRAEQVALEAGVGQAATMGMPRKRVAYLEKYANMTPEAILGAFVLS